MNNLLCEGEVPRYIFYASDIPQYIYYIFLPSIIVTFLLGLFIFFKDRKNISSRIFFILSITMVLWMISMLGNWAQNDPALASFFDAFNVIVGFVPAFFVYFILNTFYEKKESQLVRKVFIFSPLIPIILLFSSKFNVEIINLSWCETNSGKLYWYLAFLLVIYAIVAFVLLIRKYRLLKEIKDKAYKKQILLVLIGFLIWTIISVVMGVVLPLFDYPTSTLWAPISCTLFAIFITWSIVKYQFLDIKLIATQALIVAIIILIGSQFAYVQNPINRILTGVTLFLTAIGGWMLIKSVKSEAQRKEELQIMSDHLAQANDQLRKLDNAKSEFISIASHQLRTPLTAIKGFISLILEGSYGTVDSNLKDILNKVYLSNERLIALVEDMLNLSRIESGRMEYSFEKVKIEDIAREVHDTFVIRSKEKGLKLELKLPENPLPEAMTDKNKIREVISNLVDNAIKYTLKGWVVLKLSLSGDKILISVVDTGIGIPKEEIPYLFNKFSRGKDISRLNTGGTGLGLHVGKRMVDALQGNLWVESEGAGKGSTFNVEIPLEIKKEK